MFGRVRPSDYCSGYLFVGLHQLGDGGAALGLSRLHNAVAEFVEVDNSQRLGGSLMGKIERENWERFQSEVPDINCGFPS